MVVRLVDKVNILQFGDLRLLYCSLLSNRPFHRWTSKLGGILFRWFTCHSVTKLYNLFCSKKLRNQMEFMDPKWKKPLNSYFVMYLLVTSDHSVFPTADTFFLKVDAEFVRRYLRRLNKYFNVNIITMFLLDKLHLESTKQILIFILDNFITFITLLRTCKRVIIASSDRSITDLNTDWMTKASLVCRIIEGCWLLFLFVLPWLDYFNSPLSFPTACL